MMRSCLLGFMLSTSFAVLTAPAALAQVTDQTDKSEEDWRKSQKKSGNDDIFEAIKNTRGFGQGTHQTRPLGPMDSLPEDSRRHIMKERAKVIATTEPGQTPDAPYSPSEAAKTDPDLAEQEKEAWTVIMTDMKGGSGSGQQNGQGGPNKIAIAGQGGGQGGGQGSGNGQPSTSPMRGGSSQSVSDILAQIKGMKSGGGQGAQGQGQAGQGQTGQNQTPTPQPASGQGQTNTPAKTPIPKMKLPTGRIPGVSEAKTAQGILNKIKGLGSGGDSRTGDASGSGQTRAPSTSQGQGQSQPQSQPNTSTTGAGDDGQMPSGQSSQSQTQSGQTQSQDQGQSTDNAASETASQSAQGQAQAADASTQIATSQDAATTQLPAPTSPLDYIKEQRESDSSGSRSSASDFLKTKSD